MGEVWGYPKKVKSLARSHDLDAAQKLWDLSKALTAINYDSLGRPQ